MSSGAEGCEDRGTDSVGAKDRAVAGDLLHGLTAVGSGALSTAADTFYSQNPLSRRVAAEARVERTVDGKYRSQQKMGSRLLHRIAKPDLSLVSRVHCTVCGAS